MTEQRIDFREVEIRSWPDRADVVVIDIRRARVLAHYPLADPRPYVIWDVKAPYQDRAEQAVEFLEAEQEYLRACFGAGDEALVKLQPSPAHRQRIQELLVHYGLSLQDIAFSQLRQGLMRLAQQPVAALYELLCDWYDMVERHYPAGSARQDPNSWVVRAAPDRAVHHHYLARGIESREEATPEDTAVAYERFRELIDVDLEEFSFGFALRWLYYSRTEFADREPFELKALQQAGI